MPTIGWLFLLQVIAAFLLGTVVLASARRLTAAIGVVFIKSWGLLVLAGGRIKVKPRSGPAKNASVSWPAGPCR